VDTLLKAALAGVLVSLLGLLLKKTQPELAMLLALSGLLALLAGAGSLLREMKNFLDELTEGTALNEALLSPLLKVLAVSVTARLSADLCKDAGSAALASAVELIGAAAGVLVSLPLLRAVLEMIRSLL
jgi:stage III sporulation protein AD